MAKAPAPMTYPSSKPGKKTLVGIVGVTVAGLLFTAIPKEESGRTVTAKVQPTGQVTLTHVSGPQYLKAYLDIVGVATACDGLTGPEIDAARRKGTKFTEQQCTDMLEQALISKAEDVKACTPQLWDKGRDYPMFAAISLAYNVGSRNYCGSTVAKYNRVRQFVKACQSFYLWNKAGGRVVKGLVDRRSRETAACLKGAS